MQIEMFPLFVIVIGAVLCPGLASAGFPYKLSGGNGLKAYCGSEGMYLDRTGSTKQVSSYQDCAAACDDEGGRCDSFNIKLNVPNPGDIQCVLHKPSGGVSPTCDTSGNSAWYSTNNCGSNRLLSTCCDYDKYCGQYGLSECEINIIWMNYNCPGTCRNSFECGLEYNGNAADTNINCLDWASWGECEANPGWMPHYCASTCAKRRDAKECDINDRPDDQFKFSEEVNVSDTYTKEVSEQNPIKWPYIVSYFCETYAGSDVPRGLTACQTDGTYETSPYLIGREPECA